LTLGQIYFFPGNLQHTIGKRQTSMRQRLLIRRAQMVKENLVSRTFEVQIAILALSQRASAVEHG
jgi:hypothetical protein